MRHQLCDALLVSAELLLCEGDLLKSERAAREAIKVARLTHDRIMTWRSHYWLGRAYEQGLRYRRALRCYRVAMLVVRELARDIPKERFKRDFLAQFEARDSLDRYARLKQEVGRRARYDLASLNRSEAISRRMLASLSAIGQQLSSILDIDRLLASILDLAIENVGAERGVVFLRADGAGPLRPESARGLGGRDLDDLSRFSRSVIEQAAGGRTLLAVDVGQDPALQHIQSVTVNEIKSILCVPMRARGRVVGVLYLDTQKQARLFTERDRAFVESFASQAAIAIENARLFGTIRQENDRLRQEVEGRFAEIVGSSHPVRRLRETIAGLLDNDCTVLITGESGTGKEVVARAIHSHSRRRKARFMAIDCGALPEHILESELFGFSRGAFTGADRDRVGLIEEADGGTLFLDEITNTSMGFQARLLRVLQEREVRRLGENKTRRIDVRVIAATNADIQALLAAGRFRQDLYYRLNVMTIEVPPLRARVEDIPLLAQHFLARRAVPSGKSDSARTAAGSTPRVLGPGVVDALMRYDWPGNVRELENFIERLCVLTRGEVITLRDLGQAGFAAAGAHGLAPGDDPTPPRTGTGAHRTGEQMMIEDALRRHHGDKAKAARFIGWNRQKLYRRMKSYAIPEKFGKAA
jgi:Nif-specific regulatory protein